MEIKLEPISKQIKSEDLLKLICISDKDFAYLSGSLIEGMGNTASDLDIFVIKDDINNLDSQKIVYNNEVNKVSFEQFDKIGCDIEYWEKNYVIQIINQINKINFNDTNQRALNLISTDKLHFSDITSFIHRLISSELLYKLY